MSFFSNMVVKDEPKQVKLINEGKCGAFLAKYDYGEAVMKLAKDETPKRNRTMVYGFATHTLPYREVAFYKLAKLLGFQNVVPETILGEYKGTPASFQQFVHAARLREVDKRLLGQEDEKAWSEVFCEVMEQFPEEDLLQLTLLDFLAGARDRHANNYGAVLTIENEKVEWRLVGWDNSASFGLTLRRYHCVAHKYYYRSIFNLEALWSKLEGLTRSVIYKTFDGLLTPMQAHHVWLRAQFVLAFPHRMPWLVLSKGAESPEEFPPYESFFTNLCPDASSSDSLFILQHGAVSG